MNQRVPDVWGDLVEQQTLRPPATRLAMPDQPGGKHLGVVGDDQVSGSQKFREIADGGFVPVAVRTPHDEEARGAAGTTTTSRSPAVRHPQRSRRRRRPGNERCLARRATQREFEMN
jgi:hypothetical protein